MGDSFLGNNRTGFVDSSESSIHDVKDETGNASYVNDVKIEDNAGKAIDETENDRKPIKGRREAKSSKRQGRIKPVEAVAAATTIPKKVEQAVPQPRTQNVVKPQEPKPQYRKTGTLSIALFGSQSMASAIYVPYYADLDVGRYLWDPIGYRRDHGAMELVKWLAGRPEWKKMWGRDNFLVAGRINWDFRRDLKNVSDWGNGLLSYPESKNMTMLVIESSPWNNDFAIPYPTYFHPSRDDAVFQWQNRMRELKRRFLFSFAGARRPSRD
ncbi:hypothetical protein J1N35_002148 [Gossypium stocksii]|uniref:Exostosin GT47 domain-containing protein n=1 Tax=Gossypium stocksii TaxID=47602 RepID=A0A9D4AKA5_9ROSI|nr:hypothetical protein J1N35_002148 [Gossypium stocksii]